MNTVAMAAQTATSRLLLDNFLGTSPLWYKKAVVAFLLLNILSCFTAGPLITSWLILAEFIFTLAMALKCFPLLPGGLLALQAALLGLTSPTTIYQEVEHGLPVLLLVIFMVAGVHFLRDMLFRLINGILVSIHSRLLLNFVTLSVVAVLSAFLDALTILAVLVAVATGFYEVYNRTVSRYGYAQDIAPEDDAIDELSRADLDQFRAFLRGLLMHGAVGTAIGGVCTLIGEPENIVIGNVAGWSFGEFFLHVAPATLPTLAAGLLTCVLLEKARIFGYGAELPSSVRHILVEEDRRLRAAATPRDRFVLIAQGLVALLMVATLALHVAEIGLIGLAVIVLTATLLGINDEHKLAEAFTPGLPFASLLVVFFVIVAMIETQHMFKPIIDWVLGMEGGMQIFMVFLTNGLLSAISDNVFVATIYMDPLKEALDAGRTTRAIFDAQSVAVVMGTGIPSMSTPNGQAAFLFLLMSELAPKIRLGYLQMVWMALPYFIVCSLVAGAMMFFLL